jgi:hypothetical protein
MQSQSTTIALPRFFVGKEITAERISSYAPKHDALSRLLGSPDTRSVWYSKEHIRDLLNEVDYANGDGIRVFLGAYEPTHPDFPGQTCLLMVITRQATVNGNVVHQNVVLENEEDYDVRSALPRVIIGNDDDNIFKRKKDFNHGSPCPPLCDGSDGVDFP